MPVIIFVGEKWAALDMCDEFSSMEDVVLRKDEPTTEELADFSKTELELLLARGGLAKTFANKSDAVKTLKTHWTKVVLAADATPVSSMKGPSKKELLKACMTLGIEKVKVMKNGELLKTKTGEERKIDIMNKEVSCADLSMAIQAVKDQEAGASSSAK